MEKLGHKLGGDTDDRLSGNDLANLLLGGKGKGILAIKRRQRLSVFDNELEAV